MLENEYLGARIMGKPVVSFGRNESCDITLSLMIADEDRLDEAARALSRRHIYISFRDGSYYLNGISNFGTTLNGEKFEDVSRLNDGDIIGFPGTPRIIFMTIVRRS